MTIRLDAWRVLGACLVFAMLAGQTDADPPKIAAVGKKAPDFVLVDIKGTKHTLSKYRGRTIVLEWVDPACPFVQRHYRGGSMQATHKKARGLDEAVVWLAINSTAGATAEQIAFWAGPYKLPYPILLDPDAAVATRFDARRAPQMYVIDKEGVLRYRGAIDDNPLAAKDPKEVRNFVLAAIEAITNGTEVERDDEKPYGCAIKKRG